MRKIGKIFSKFDLFGYSPALRSNSDSETKNGFGGLIALAMMALFVYIFYS